MTLTRLFLCFFLTIHFLGNTELFLSADQALGVYHPKYVTWLKYFGIVFSIGISIGFTVIPIYIYLINA